MLLRLLALAPGLQGDEEEAAVGVADAAEQIEADHREVYPTPGVFVRIASHLRAASLVRCSEAALGSCTPDIDVALVLFGQKAAGQLLARRRPRASATRSRKIRLMAALRMRTRGETDVAVGGAAKDAVEPA